MFVSFITGNIFLYDYVRELTKILAIGVSEILSQCQNGAYSEIIFELAAVFIAFPSFLRNIKILTFLFRKSFRDLF